MDGIQIREVAVSQAVVFETAVQQGVTCTMFFIGASIMASLISRRTIGMSLFSWSSWRSVSHTRFLVILIFIISWCFVMTTGILLFGVGASKNQTSCTIGILNCIGFYAISKLLISCFLLEKVYIVSGYQGSRFKLRTYQIGLALISIYAVIITLAVLGRNAYFDENNSCRIGLKVYVTAPLVTYDILLNLYLTLCFVLPLRSKHFINLPLRAIALRSLIAGCTAMTASTINIVLIAAFEGHQVAWQCLLCCTVDVTVNALVLYWVTSGKDQMVEMGGGTTHGLVGSGIQMVEDKVGGEGGADSRGRGEKPDSAGIDRCVIYPIYPTSKFSTDTSLTIAADRRPSMVASSSGSTAFLSAGSMEAARPREKDVDEEDEISFEAFLNYSIGPEKAVGPGGRREKRRWVGQQLQAVLFGEERVAGRSGPLDFPGSRRPSLAVPPPVLRDSRITAVPELDYRPPIQYEAPSMGSTGRSTSADRSLNSEEVLEEEKEDTGRIVDR